MQSPKVANREVEATNAPIARSKKVIFLVLLLVMFASALVMPTYPALLLQLSGGAKDTSSVYYGIVTLVRHCVEFFACPLLGSLSDTFGRKTILIISMTTGLSEFFLLAFFPTVPTIFVGRFLSGFDATMAMVYAMLADIALVKNQSVTEQFGSIGAIGGIAFIVGPILGSYLSLISIPLCFGVAGLIVALALAITVFFLQESCIQFETRSDVVMNPFKTLQEVLSHNDLLHLSVPYMMSSLSSGIYFIWVLYMNIRFRASILQIGLFLSVSGMCAVIVQGFLVKQVVPRIWSDGFTVYCCMALAGAQLVLYGFCQNMISFYVVMILFAPCGMYAPALKSIIVHKSDGVVPMGAVQGALGSLRTLTSGIGSMLFTGVFALTLDMQPHFYSAPFFLGATIYAVGWAFIRMYLLKADEKEGLSLLAERSPHWDNMASLDRDLTEIDSTGTGTGKGMYGSHMGSATGGAAMRVKGVSMPSIPTVYSYNKLRTDDTGDGLQMQDVVSTTSYQQQL